MATTAGTKTGTGTTDTGTTTGTADTTSSPELADELRLAIGRLARRIRQQSTLGLTPSQYSALVSIGQLEPVRSGDLAAVEGVSAPTVTKVLAMLEEAGLIARAADAADRRSSLVRLTDHGSTTLQHIRTERTAFLRRRLDALPTADRKLLAAALPVLAALVDTGVR